jgi:hypothetical protein
MRGGVCVILFGKESMTATLRHNDSTESVEEFMPMLAAEAREYPDEIPEDKLAEEWSGFSAESKGHFLVFGALSDEECFRLGKRHRSPHFWALHNYLVDSGLRAKYVTKAAKIHKMRFAMPLCDHAMIVMWTKGLRMNIEEAISGYGEADNLSEEDLIAMPLAAINARAEIAETPIEELSERCDSLGDTGRETLLVVGSLTHETFYKLTGAVRGCEFWALYAYIRHSITFH